MSRKRWVVGSIDTALSSEISERFNLNPFASLIMVSRGITQDEDAYEFLSLSPDFISPYCLIDMNKAKERIQWALAAGEKIAVYGDYDADGITATAILYKYLCSRGADAVWYIPERSEGYGLRFEAIDKLKAEGVKLIITVDNGIAAVNEAKYIEECSMELVITDHHEPPEVLPRAVAIVDAHRKDCPSEFKDYAGVGVAFKLICALEDADGEAVVELLGRYGEYVALGTIGDIVPLTGENRLLVKYGLYFMKNTKKPDISQLKTASGFKANSPLTAEQVAFGLVPRVNACGRVGFACEAAQLFMSEDWEQAKKLSDSVNLYNYERKRIEQEVFAEADRRVINANMHILDRVIVVSGDGWNEGVLGIVSARLTNKYGKPSVVLSENAGVARGSCRSIEGFNIYSALSSVSSLLRVFGGHSMAAGLTLDSAEIDNFKAAVNKYARDNFEFMPFPELLIDCRLNPKALRGEMINGFEVLEPFGASNPSPIFGLFNVTVESVRGLSDGKYVRVLLSKNSAAVNAVCFYSGLKEFPFRQGDVIDAAVRISRSTYYADGGISVRLIDARMAGNYEDELLRSMRIYEKAFRGDKMNGDELREVIPSRDTFASVYRFLKSGGGFYGEPEMIYHRLSRKFSFSSIMVSLDVLAEMGLIHMRNEGERCRIEMTDGGKCDLSSSQILTSLGKRANAANG